MRHRIGMFATAAVVVLTACSGGPAANGEGRLRVVATTTQVGAVAAEIGGDAIALTVLLAPGAEAHDFEMTPAQAAAIEDAAIVLRSGAGLETWLDDELATIGGSEKVRDMSDGVSLLSATGTTGDGEHAGEVDPHYWLSAPRAIVMVENVRDALAAAEPEAAAGFAERAGELIARLEAADTRIRELIDEIPAAERKIVTNHDALGYFIDEYGLTFVGSVFPSLDVSSEPDPGTLAELVDTLRREHVPAIFSESAVNPELARTLASESGAHVVDDPLYTDSLGPPGSGAETLDGMLIHDATVIHDALVGG